MLKPEYERHIKARFAAAKVNYDPFPHLVIQDVLPPALYAQMELDCPSDIESLIASLGVIYKGGRFGLSVPVAIWVKNQPLFALRPNNPTTFPLHRYVTLWEKYQPYINLVDTLTVQVFNSAIDTLLRQMQQCGFIKDARSPVNRGQGVFSHRTKEWYIKPHIHSVGQIVQSMIYFPLPGSSPEQGTVLYRLRKEMSVTAAALMKTFVFHDEEIEPVGMMPYLSNTLASFVNTPLAIHASPSVKGPSRRYTFTAAAISDVYSPSGTVSLKESFSCSTS